MMSSDVARALALLDLNVRWVGAERQPSKGTPDDAIARIAQSEKRYIFTSNFDMILAAASEGAAFIWFFDGEHNALTKFDTARLFFRKWQRWERLLTDESIECLRVSRHRTTPTTFERARRQAEAQMRRRAVHAAPPSIPPRAQPRGTLSFHDD